MRRCVFSRCFLCGFTRKQWQYKPLLSGAEKPIGGTNACVTEAYSIEPAVRFHSSIMGLDTVELLIETEKLYGVEFSQAEVAEFRSVGDLYNGVRSKRSGSSASEDTPTWHEFRQFVGGEIGIEAHRIEFNSTWRQLRID